ncbi:MAG TPA: heavy metal translocating P-type ATPase, partial [Firmicutes bacterium]|nr:heavy metal translocating P-type ATPase [Bacillota bacterium]
MDKVVRQKKLKITGMSCASCAAGIEKSLNRLEGVRQASVNLALEQATVEYDDQAVKPETITTTIKRLGYDIIDDQNTETVKLNVKGMTCAACSARVEKKLNQLPGVEKAGVNLATEIATVEYDGSKVKVADLLKAVEALGYQAVRAEEISRDREKEAREKETRRLRREFIISAVVSSPLMLAMFLSMFGIDVPFLHNAYFQLIIATPIQFIIGSRFYKNAY